MRQQQRRVTTGRQQEAVELRDACMLLAARHGTQREVGGAPVLEARLGPFTVRLTPGGAPRAGGPERRRRRRAGTGAALVGRGA
jgi:hypothetical protein